MKDELISLLIFIFLIGIIIFPNLKKTTISLDYDNRAYRSEKEINESNIVYLDLESIALSDSSNDTELKSKAIIAFNIVNNIRQENGVNPLKWDSNLECISNVRAREICNKFSHTRPNGQPWYTINSNLQGGENLAYGYDNSEDVVNAWLNSQTHKENLLYEGFNKVAISIYEQDGVYYWSQEFGY